MRDMGALVSCSDRADGRPRIHDEPECIICGALQAKRAEGRLRVDSIPFRTQWEVEKRKLICFFNYLLLLYLQIIAFGLGCNLTHASPKYLRNPSL